MWAARIASVRAELAAQLGERDAGALGDVGKADPLERLLGEQRHEGVDDALAWAGVGERVRDGTLGGGATRAGTFCSRAMTRLLTLGLLVH